MWECIETILLVVFEVLCCNIFFESFGERRYKEKNRVNVLQMLVFCLCGYISAECIQGYFLFRQMINIACITLMMYWHMKICLKKIFMLTVLYEGVLLGTDYVAFFVNNSIFSETDNMLQIQLVILLGKAMLFVCVLLVRRIFSDKKCMTLSKTQWLRVLVFPIFTIVIITAMLSVFQTVENEGQKQVLFLTANGTTIMNVIVFYLIWDIMRCEMRLYQDKLFQMQVKNQVSMYDSIAENFERQKEKTHEYKNQILCIETLLAKKQYEQLEEYVKNIYGSLNEEIDVIHTNHVFVNAILNTKYQEMKEKGITFVSRINNLSDLEICDEDIVILLSNLLNNAIEACELCKEKRVIQLKFIKECEKAIIAVKNSCERKLVYKDGKIQSTKQIEPQEHGVGIKNIIKIVEKYAGSYLIKEQDGEFLFSIEIPLIKNQDNTSIG